MKNFIVFILILFISCNKETNELEKLSNSAFIELIANNNNSKKGIVKIDSLIKSNIFSNERKALLYYNKANYLIDLGSYIETIVYTKKALVVFEENKNDKFIGLCHNVLGNANLYLNNNKKALEHINETIKIFIDLKDDYNLSIGYDALAHLHFLNNDFEKAIENLKIGVKYKIKSDKNKTLSASYNNIAFVLEAMNDYENAILYYKKAININEKGNVLDSDAHRNLGSVYLINNEPEKCITLYLKALEIEKRTGHLALQQDIYNILIDSVKSKKLRTFNGLDKYIENIPIYIKNRDSIKNLISELKNKDIIKGIEDKYKLQNKKAELEQEVKINNKNKWIFTIIIMVFLFFTLFLIQRNRNKALKLKHDNIVLEQKVLRSQMNPHFIFNALTSIQKNLLEDDILQSSTSLSRFAKLIRQNFEFINKKTISLDEDLNALQNYIETQQLRFTEKFDYEINIQKGLDISYIEIPPMLLQPFVENAIEHGIKPLKIKGMLTVNVLRTADLLHFEIIDNGIGYSKITKKDNREHAIDIFKKRLKLRNLKEEKLFKIGKSTNNRGTIVSFSLKL